MTSAPRRRNARAHINELVHDPTMDTTTERQDLSEIRTLVDTALVAVLTDPPGEVARAEESVASALRTLDDQAAEALPHEVILLLHEAANLLALGKVKAARGPLVSARGKLAQPHSRHYTRPRKG